MVSMQHFKNEARGLDMTQVHHSIYIYGILKCFFILYIF